MKKSLILAGVMLLAAGSTVMAAPINQLGKNDTTISVGTKEIAVEHKFASKLTVGYQNADRDQYDRQNDVYAQYDVIGSQLKLVGGYRMNMPGDKNNAYGGIAVSTPRVLGFDAYASYVAGKDFNETQVGINKNLLLNVDLNINYHNYKPDHAKRENGVGAGITVHF